METLHNAQSIMPFQARPSIARKEKKKASHLEWLACTGVDKMQHEEEDLSMKVEAQAQ